ncbi:hypothetical protein AALK46_07370 [Staphylococcus nepalensis]|uniref:hypothetical protein n=1 Tax=Staphylococcus nepalensis TaxID=214473 RepID=UPI003510ECB7
MNEPTEIKYPLDENGEPYFAATHIDAVKGLEFDEDGDLKSTVIQLQNNVKKLESDIKKQDDIIAGYEERISEIETSIPKKEGK